MTREWKAGGRREGGRRKGRGRQPEKLPEKQDRGRTPPPSLPPKSAENGGAEEILPGLWEPPETARDRRDGQFFIGSRGGETCPSTAPVLEPSEGIFWEDDFPALGKILEFFPCFGL